MNAKRKIASSVATMISMIVIAVLAITLPLTMQNAKNKAQAQIINSYGVAATVAGNCYVGAKSQKMMSGESDTIVFAGDDTSSCPALNPTEALALSSRNDYVVFEYIFTNTSDNVAFVANITNTIEVKNMNLTFAYSYQKLGDFSNINFSDLESVPLANGNGNALYLYIKAKVADLNCSSSLNGSFCFNLIAEDVYEINLIEGELHTKTYAALGYKLTRVEVPSLLGMKFEGYYTMPFGMGEQIYDENGESQKIWAQENGETLYAHFTAV